MSKYTDAIFHSLRKNHNELMSLPVLDEDVSEEFAKLVRREGDKHLAITDVGVASTYLYFGQHYFDEWQDDDEVSNSMIQRLMTTIVMDTDFND